MIYFSLGLPGRLADWCDAAIGRLAGLDGEPVAVTAFPSLAEQFAVRDISPVLQESAAALIRTDAAHLVMGARQPDARLRTALLDAEARFVVALDDPRIAVAEIHGQGSGDLRTITRAVANSCPLVMRCSVLPGALTIRSENVRRDALATLLAIAKHLGITATDHQARGLVAELECHGLGAGTSAAEWSAGIPADAYKLVDGALGGYAAHFGGDRLGELVWMRDLFLLATAPDRGPTEPVKLSDDNVAFFLIFGPYMNLPPGSWSARVVMGLSPAAVGQTLTIDAYAGRQLVSTQFTSRVAGVYSPEINFTVDEETSQGIEIRVLVTRHGTPGQLAFGHVTLRPIAVHADMAANPQDDFTAAYNL